MPVENKVPMDACRFSCKLSIDKESDDGKIPVNIKARDGGVLNHWYWGPNVHDMDGMELHKDSLTIDYCHYDDEVLGYADSFDVRDGDLLVGGALVPYGENDRATEVFTKSKAGVPYEASIFFDGPLRIEEIEKGDEVEVNGRSFIGPLLIFRKWSLRGIAICPYGYDRNTKTQFSKGDRVVAVETQKKNAVPDTIPDTNGDLKKFADAFGIEKGGQWLLDGLTFEQASEKFSAERNELCQTQQTKITELTSQLDETKTSLETVTKERDELKSKVESLQVENKKFASVIDRGEETPMETVPEGAKKQTKPSVIGSPAIDAFASKFKVPEKAN